MQPEVWTAAVTISGLLALVALVAALVWRARRASQAKADGAAAHLSTRPPAPVPLPGADARRDGAPTGSPPVGAQAPPAADLAAPPPAPEAPPTAASPAPAAEATVAAPPVDPSLRLGLARTQSSLLERIKGAFSSRPSLDAEAQEGLEEALLLADVGVGLTTRLLASLRDHHKAAPLTTLEAITQVLRGELVAALRLAPTPTPAPTRPRVILLVGVNGVGKTTSIGKLAAHMVASGASVMLAAGDTFRAAAAEQLEVWSQRAGAAFHRGEAEADPAAVVFGAISRARAEAIDVVLADTAGRLHTKVDLMGEIAKVRRAADKASGGGQAEVWLVVDGTTGQNALQQAREFNRAVGLSGVILTKLDGTAKGGVVVAIVDDLKVPIRYLGVGEKIDDLRPFDAQSFVAALLTPA